MEEHPPPTAPQPPYATPGAPLGAPSIGVPPQGAPIAPAAPPGYIPQGAPPPQPGYSYGHPSPPMPPGAQPYPQGGAVHVQPNPQVQQANFPPPVPMPMPAEGRPEGMPDKPPQDSSFMDKLTHQTIFHWNPDSNGWRVERVFTIFSIVDLGLMILFYIMLLLTTLLILTAGFSMPAIICLVSTIFIWGAMLFSNTCASRVSRTLGNKKTMQEMEVRLAELRAAPLDCKFNMTCWHYEQKSHGRDRDGPRRKVHTHSATMKFRYRQWMDNAPISLGWMTDFPRVFAKFEVTRTLGNDTTEEVYKDTRDNFRNSNRRDTNNDFSVEDRVDGFDEEEVLLCATEDDKSGMGSCLMILAAILGFAGYFKAKQRMNNPTARVVMEKRIFV